MSERREQIERTADRIRDEWLVTLQELDRRKEEATDLRLQARRHAGVFVSVGAGLTALVGGAVAFGVWRTRHRQRLRMQKRWEAARRAWNQPERLAVRSEDRAWPVELVQKLGLALGLAFGTQFARRTAQALLPVNT